MASHENRERNKMKPDPVVMALVMSFKNPEVIARVERFYREISRVSSEELFQEINI